MRGAAGDGLVDGAFTAFVAEASTGGLAACGIATVAQRLPAPGAGQVALATSSRWVTD